MKVFTLNTKEELGKSAADYAVGKIRQAIKNKGFANIILATGASQFETLKNLVSAQNIDWMKVTMFHLDEYIGISDRHPASFRKYLKERFVDKVPPLNAVYFVNPELGGFPENACEHLNGIIKEHPIDMACVGIGENGHLAFNDPPADFDTEKPFIIVNLDKKCRQQQLGEGWFKSLDEVPKQAISMSIRQIMKSRSIIVSVPDGRKARAVKDCLEGEICNRYPASILQTHPDCSVYLDKPAASLLEKEF